MRILCVIYCYTLINYIKNKPIPMPKSNMSFDTRNAKIYKDIYRPSSNLTRFFRTILSVILIGQSPVTHTDHHYRRK